MDLQAKTSQKCKQFSGLLIHLDKKIFEIWYWVFYCKENEKSLEQLFLQTKKVWWGFFSFFFIQKPVIHLLYIQQVLYFEFQSF